MGQCLNLFDRNKFDVECSICLKSFNKDKVYLNCNHFFHKNCINDWRRRSNTCPYCRTVIIQMREEDIKIEKKFQFTPSTNIFLIIFTFIIVLFIILYRNYVFPEIFKKIYIPKKLVINFFQSLMYVIYLIIKLVFNISRNMILLLLSGLTPKTTSEYYLW